LGCSFSFFANAEETTNTTLQQLLPYNGTSRVQQLRLLYNCLNYQEGELGKRFHFRKLTSKSSKLKGSTDEKR